MACLLTLSFKLIALKSLYVESLLSVDFAVGGEVSPIPAHPSPPLLSLSCSHLAFAVLLTVHCASVALADASIHRLALRALTTVPRAAHHVFAKRAPLLDGRFQILVRLLLDSLRVL